MKVTRKFALKFIALFGLVSFSNLYAQMVSPSIDKPGEPFSYFSKPTDEIGVMDAEAATEITPEGYLRTGYGELMFFSGVELEPVNVRLRTLEEGRYPIIHYKFERDGIEYHVAAFAATLDGKSDGRLVNFIRISMKNNGAAPLRAVLGTAIRYDAPDNTSGGHGDNRFRRPVENQVAGTYRQIGEKFNPDWVYSFNEDGFLRDGRLLYTYPAGYTLRGYTQYTHNNYPPDISKPEKTVASPSAPLGFVTYSEILAPGKERVLDFRMPVVPTDDAADMAEIAHADYDKYHQQTIQAWKAIYNQGMSITLSESKAADAFYANLMYDLVARDYIGGDYIQTVNKLHYHSFYLRDGADIAHSYDVTGYPEIARQVLDFFAKSQKPDGNFLSQPQQYDGWGEALYGYGQHYRITHDKQFAEWALPQIQRAVEWLKQARAKDAMHIMPSSDVRDNEYIPGHLTGYNFLALSGLRLSIEMAAQTGHADLAKDWQKEYDDYQTAFFKVLDEQAKANNAYIPPALDGQKEGYDWGNMLAVVPEPILDPHDPRVTATLKATQDKYAEGIMTYAHGMFLHHYLTIKNTLTELVRGDQEQAIKEFYALLLHTSSTHAGFEYKIRPWGNRDFTDNLSPHGWFSAEYRTLLRNMLVREEGKQLHLLSAISPAWIGPGKNIGASQVPTYFGPLSFKMAQLSNNEAVLSFHNEFIEGHQPENLVIHIPWFMHVDSVQVNGKPAQVSQTALVVPANVWEVRLKWTMKSGTPQLSYEQAVKDYKAEYARRYNTLMHGESAK